MAIGVTVTYEQAGSRPRPDLNLLTNAEGRWETPLLPADLTSDSLRLLVAHPDYVSDSIYDLTPTPPIEELRDETATIVLKRGVVVSGTGVVARIELVYLLDGDRIVRRPTAVVDRSPSGKSRLR